MALGREALEPAREGIQKPNRWLFQQRAPEQQVRGSDFDLFCPVNIKSPISSQLPSGSAFLLCCEFLYFIMLQNFCHAQREVLLNDTGSSGIKANQAITYKQKGSKEYHENLWHVLLSQHIASQHVSGTRRWDS